MTAMMQDHRYDVVVIGSGPSGRTVSLRSAKKGFSVVLIESELVGGDCHYWACIPSKALLRHPEGLTASSRDLNKNSFESKDWDDDSALGRCC